MALKYSVRPCSAGDLEQILVGLLRHDTILLDRHAFVKLGEADRDAYVAAGFLFYDLAKWFPDTNDYIVLLKNKYLW